MKSIWEKTWTVRDAWGNGGQALVHTGTDWQFELKPKPGHQVFKVKLVAGTPVPVQSWKALKLYAQGSTVLPWHRSTANLPVWNGAATKTQYKTEITSHENSATYDTSPHALRLEGSLDADHVVQLVWIPAAVAHGSQEIVLIRVIPEAGVLQSGTGHGDPR